MYLLHVLSIERWYDRGLDLTETDHRLIIKFFVFVRVNELETDYENFLLLPFGNSKRVGNDSRLSWLEDLVYPLALESILFILQVGLKWPCNLGLVLNRKLDFCFSAFNSLHHHFVAWYHNSHFWQILPVSFFIKLFYLFERSLHRLRIW